MRAYELGTVFRNSKEGGKLPDEYQHLSIGVYGEDEDFFSLKGMIEALFDSFGIKGVSYRAKDNSGMFHPGRCAEMFLDKDGNEVYLGIMGEVHPSVLDNFDFDNRPAIAEICFDAMIKVADREVHYEKPPRFPAVTRDIAVIVDRDMEVGALIDAMDSVDSEILEGVELFDIYRGLPIPPDMKSCAFSLTYRSADRTLTDDEVDEVNDRIISMLKEKFGAKLREQ